MPSPMDIFSLSAEEQKKIEEEKSGNPPADKPADKPDDKVDPPKKDKGVQFKELSLKAERLEKELEATRKEAEELKKFKPLSKVAEYVSSKFGEINEDTVDQYINKNKTRKKEVEELSFKYKEKDSALKDINITQSDEWKNEYALPLSTAVNNLSSVIVEIGPDKNIKHPELFQKLQHELLAVDEKGNPLTSVQIKGIMKKFANDYEEKTGEEYDVPRINEVVDNVNLVHSRHAAAVKAKANWEKTLEEKQKSKLFEQSKQNELLAKKEIEGIVYIGSKARKEFDDKVLDGVLAPEEIEEQFNGIVTSIVKVKKDEQKPEGYDVVMTRLAKGNMFDPLLAKYRQLEKELAIERKKNGSSLPSTSDRHRRPNVDNSEETDERVKTGNPLDIFKQ